jgi:hypothetical protein
VVEFCVFQPAASHTVYDSQATNRSSGEEAGGLSQGALHASYWSPGIIYATTTVPIIHSRFQLSVIYDFQMHSYALFFIGIRIRVKLFQLSL